MLRIAILGTGKLATDLLVKVNRSPHLQCVAFAGRRINSEGIAFAKNLGTATSHSGLSYLVENADQYELVFDVTSALAHETHARVFADLGKTVIDLTPSHTGHFVVPCINLQDSLDKQDISLISCGGQASLPMISAISKICLQLESIEVVSSIASRSAGKATRNNIDEYIEKTEEAITHFSNCKDTKTVLILNPASPEINMKTTIYVKGDLPSAETIRLAVLQVEYEMQQFVPGYHIKVPPTSLEGVLSLSLEVEGYGDFLPKFAGNLDIITAAAVKIAEGIAMNRAKLEELYAARG